MPPIELGREVRIGERDVTGTGIVVVPAAVAAAVPSFWLAILIEEEGRRELPGQIAHVVRRGEAHVPGRCRRRPLLLLLLHGHAGLLALA